MMDDFEKKECLKILDLLTLDNLLSLTDTVTGRVVTVENKEEAVNAVMLYTRSSEELLRRRKVRRENLYQYLAQEGHVEHPAADKNTLLKKVLKLWRLKKQGGDLKDMGDTGFTLAQPGDNVTVNVTELATQSGQHDTQTITFAPSDQRANKNTSLNASTADGVNSSNTNTTEGEIIPDGNEAQALAIHFSSWFYKLLDSLANSSPGVDTPPDWGPQHFWQDAKLTVQCEEQSGLQETTVEGADLVSEKFLSMVVVDRLYFNPNISPDSVKGKQNPHGLVVVLVCGTVHRQKEYLGVFEQSFGLIRDPSEENNWKIKFSKLMLKASGSGSENRLENQEPQNQLEGPV